MSTLAFHPIADISTVAAFEQIGAKEIKADSKPTQSTAIFNGIEAAVCQKEDEFGRERLLKAVAKVTLENLSRHVNRYRSIVRTHRWPNESHVSSLDAFLGDYERSSLIYVEIGFDALNYVDGNSTLALNAMFERVLGSEALRGQFGKRCPTGLDARLESYLAIVEAKVLSIVPFERNEDAVHLLCTPVKPALAAEALLLEDFAELREEFNVAPSIEEVLTATGSRKDVVWKFLRRHVRWSVADLGAYYHYFNTALFEERLKASRIERATQEAQRLELVADIASRTSAEICAEILSVAAAATTLNHLNLTLEPIYSFKGGPGLAQRIVFEQAEVAGLCASVSQEQIISKKRELFALSIFPGKLPRVA